MADRPAVTIVGLGPGGRQHVTLETLAAIERIPHRYLRTARHPSADLVSDAVTFDHVYDSAERFDDVYAAIVDALAAAAAEHGEVLYAVPGSPLVLERTVRSLLADVLPAMSFLDLVWARLGIDPVESAVRLVDGHEFAVAAAGATGAMLVTHTHARWVLSDVKLAAEEAGGDEAVVVLQQLARTLRERCPWDREQTHASLVPYLVEETYELVDALEALDTADPATDEALIEELGDVLYQIEFHATIAEQAVQAAAGKFRRRFAAGALE